MTLFQRNLFACFMGFAVLSLFNVNHAFADDKKAAATEQVKLTMMKQINF